MGTCTGYSKEIFCQKAKVKDINQNIIYCRIKNKNMAYACAASNTNWRDDSCTLRFPSFPENKELELL